MSDGTGHDDDDGSAGADDGTGDGIGEVVGEGASAPRRRRVAVTTLADFACRAGDLDPGGVIGPSAREGMIAHRRVQEGRGGVAESEVRLSRRLCIDGETLELVGRLDLLERGRRALGEIKSTLVPPERVPPVRRALHRAQLMLYGWLYLGEPEVGDAPLTLEVLYVNLRAATGTATSVVEPAVEGWQANADELVRHATRALRVWLYWQRGRERRRRALVSSAATLAFPHERFRAGQRSLSVAVYRCLRDGGALLCEAPTGSGKTMSSLYPSLKALGEGHRRRLFYLTAKVSGRQSALESLRRLSEAGLMLSALVLRSRRDACFCERGDIDAERDAEGRCPMTLGFFDRLPAAREVLVEDGVLTAARLDEVARRYRLCPHALAIHLLPWMDVVVGDYNHVFDPLSRLTGLDEPLPRTALLIDEAHNLPERARGMFSATLSRLDCRQTARRCAASHPLVAQRIERVAAALLRLARGHEVGERAAEPPSSALCRHVARASEAIVSSAGTAPALPEDTHALLLALTRFAFVTELAGEAHRTLIDVRRHAREREVRLRLVCLDATEALTGQGRRFGALVAFSATLAPLAFYRDALGLASSTPVLSVAPSFDASRALYCVVPWIDTRYRRREASLPALIALIRQVSDSRVGNHLVFLPSHDYLGRVHDAFARACPERETWCQRVGESAETRAAALARLDVVGHRVGFVVLGGVYGEGVDYVGERLVGAVVVGTGLPGTDLEHEMRVARYRRQGADGFDLASRYPGFTRVRQSAGRVIRDERDRGVIVLVDPRFGETFYRRLLPAYWRTRWPHDPPALARLLAAFWDDVSL